MWVSLFPDKTIFVRRMSRMRSLFSIRQLYVHCELGCFFLSLGRTLAMYGHARIIMLTLARNLTIAYGRVSVSLLRSGSCMRHMVHKRNYIIMLLTTLRFFFFYGFLTKVWISKPILFFVYIIQKKKIIQNFRSMAYETCY